MRQTNFILLLILLVYFIAVSRSQSHYQSNSTAAVSSFAPSAPIVPSDIDRSDGAVLVLGSGGLIGRALTSWLIARDYRVFEVPNRRVLDLRAKNSLDIFSNEKISFAFFLACEVGGSKFIDAKDSNIQQAIIENNIAIYNTVLPFLQSHNIPFIFTSSYLQHLDTAYGAVKRLGEQWIKNIQIGKIVRLWNIYGREKIGAKAHVMTDWTHNCATQGIINSLTDGNELRQFTHANDTASALGLMMRNYQSLDQITELAGAEWSTMRDIAMIVANKSPIKCSINFSSAPATVRKHLLPDNQTWWQIHSGWTPNISLSEGIKDLFQSFINSNNNNDIDDEQLIIASPLSSSKPPLPSYYSSSSMFSFSLFSSSNEFSFHSVVHRNFSSLMPPAKND